MNVPDAFIDVAGGPQTVGDSLHNEKVPHATGSEGKIRLRDASREGSKLGSVAAGSKEKRLIRRHYQRFLLSMSVFNQGPFYQAQIVDYSQDGMGVETQHPILPGTSLYVRVDSSPAVKEKTAAPAELRTIALAEVKWCRALGQGRPPRYRIGLRFYQYY
jgi:hypothetical protein